MRWNVRSRVFERGGRKKRTISEKAELAMIAQNKRWHFDLLTPAYTQSGAAPG